MAKPVLAYFGNLVFFGTRKVGPVRFHPTSRECDTVLHLILRPMAEEF